LTHHCRSKTEFTIREAPIPLKRPRITRSGRVYDPNKQLKAKTLEKINIAAHRALKIEGPVHIDFVFCMQVPKSASKKKQADLEGKFHAIKPDIDNLVKYYLDVIADKYIEDDSRVVSMTARKIQKMEPYVKISISQVNDENTNVSSTNS